MVGKPDPATGCIPMTLPQAAIVALAKRSSGVLGLRLFKAVWTALIAVAQAECDLRNAAVGDPEA